MGTISNCKPNGKWITPSTLLALILAVVAGTMYVAAMGSDVEHNSQCIDEVKSEQSEMRAEMRDMHDLLVGIAAKLEVKHRGRDR